MTDVRTLEDLLADQLADQPLAPQARASQHPCQVSKFHSPRPLLVARHTYGMRSWWMCGTCAGNLSVYLMLTESGPLPWEVAREFGNEVRRVGNEIRSAEAGTENSPGG
jgi:hypothetical protein